MQAWVMGHERFNAFEIVRIDSLLKLTDLRHGSYLGLELRPAGKAVETRNLELRVGEGLRATRLEKIFGLLFQMAEIGTLGK